MPTKILGAPAVLALLCLATPASALEKFEARDGPGESPWRGGSSTTIRYYNACNDWYWIGSVYDAEVDGVVFESPQAGAELIAVDLLQYRWVTHGYPYEATVAVHAVDSQDCPVGAPLASQPYLPAWDNTSWGVWVTYSWNIPVPSRFALTVTFPDWTFPADPPRIVWDHPSAGPGDPEPPCGSCYPANRPPHSFIFDDDGGPYCPGFVWYDLGAPTCPPELVWQARFGSTVGVEPQTWGRVKTLYR